MSLRHATSSDLPRIQEIYNQAIVERIATCDEDERSLEDRRAWFAQFNERHPIYVKELEGRVVAYGCLFKFSPKTGYRFAVENSLYVDRQWRGRGLGRDILAHLIAAARERGYRYLEAKIFTHNHASLDLHKSLGFRIVGIQKNVANLDGQWLDNTILSLDLFHDAKNAPLRVQSGAPWEKAVGYCRAIRKNNVIAVSGTTSMCDGKVFAPGDPYRQTLRCLQIIEAALRELASSRRDVMRTRIFVSDIAHWEAIGRAHAEFFGESVPATSMLEVKRLIDPELLVEIEADAIS